MKRTVSIITAGLAAAALTFGGATLASADTSAPDADEKSSLAFSREEEKMAHDLYTEFGELYDSAVWDRIVNSEQRHFDAIGRLLDQFDVADPSDGNKAGEYNNKDVQKLYDDWLAQGEKSEAEAFKAAIALEKRDIADLEKQLKSNTNDDIEAVYERLLAGSENHLAAFTAWAKGEPVTGMQQGQRMQGQQNEARRAERSAVCDGTGMDDTDRGNADAPRDGSGDQLRDGTGNENAPRRGMNRGNA